MGFYPEDTGLWGMGEVTINGPEVTPWLHVLPTSTTPKLTQYGISFLPAVAGTSLTLVSVPVGWRTGDSIAVGALDGSYVVAKIVSITGAQITFDTSFTADAVSTTDATGAVIARFPVVANLSRRFVISSADVVEGDPNHRAHVAMMMPGCGDYSYVEFRNLGPRGKLGRYPIHFHLMGDESCCKVDSCSMWQSVTDPGNRFISVHQTSFVTVSNNVGLRSRGHGFFSENGKEDNNHWTGNLSIDVSSPEELTVANTPKVLDASGGGSYLSGSHHFWLYNGSEISGNVAIGPKPVVGLKLTPNLSTIGLIVQKNLLNRSNPNSDVVVNCEFYGTGDYGVWSLVPDTKFVNTTVLYCGAIGNHETAFPPIHVEFDNPIFAFNGIANVSPYRGQLYFDDNVIPEHKAKVVGGVLAGDVLINAHYHAIVDFTGTRFVGTNLLSPTYWQLGVLLTNCVFDCDIVAQTSQYINHQWEPGLLRIVNGSGRVGSVLISKPIEDFIYTGFAKYFSGGAPEKVNAVRLSSPAPDSGFISRPPTGDTYPQSENWTIDPAGAKPGTLYRGGDPYRYIHDLWSLSLASGMGGYPYGFPPGSYDVRIKQKDGSTKTFLGVVVKAGEVTQM